MKKTFLFIFLFSFIISGCGVPQKEYDALSVLLYESQSELKKYKDKYGEMPVLDSANRVFGIWNIGTYVDEFGEKTDNKFVFTTLNGTFSNSATTNSDLKVRFIVKNENEITINLYEYGRNHPVKDSGLHSVIVKDKDGDRYDLVAWNHSDELKFGNYRTNLAGETYHKEEDSRIMFKVLLKGGLIKFRIQNKGYSTSEYNFIINNADYLSEAISYIN